MSKIILTVAALSSIAFSVPALAGYYDAGERAAYIQTQHEEATVKVPFPVLIEGRNAAVKTTVEPYIAQSVEQNARSH